MKEKYEFNEVLSLIGEQPREPVGKLALIEATFYNENEEFIDVSFETDEKLGNPRGTAYGVMKSLGFDWNGEIEEQIGWRCECAYDTTNDETY